VRTEQRHHVVGVRVAPEHRLREDQLAAYVYVEDAVRARDDLDAADALFELLQNVRCQTDSVWASPSGNAVLDADHGSVAHETSLFGEPVAAACKVANAVRRTLRTRRRTRLR